MPPKSSKTLCILSVFVKCRLSMSQASKILLSSTKSSCVPGAQEFLRVIQIHMCALCALCACQLVLHSPVVGFGFATNAFPATVFLSVKCVQSYVLSARLSVSRCFVRVLWIQCKLASMRQNLLFAIQISPLGVSYILETLRTLQSMCWTHVFVSESSICVAEWYVRDCKRTCGNATGFSSMDQLRTSVCRCAKAFGRTNWVVLFVNKLAKSFFLPLMSAVVSLDLLFLLSWREKIWTVRRLPHSISVALYKSQTSKWKGWLRKTNILPSFERRTSEAEAKSLFSALVKLTVCFLRHRNSHGSSFSNWAFVCIHVI